MVFFSTPKRIWVNFGTPKTHGGGPLFHWASRHIPWLLLVLQNPKARPWLCLAPGDGAISAHLTMMKSRDVMLFFHDSTTTIHVSWKYKIQFCCHTNLFGEWPSNVMVNFEKTASTASESDENRGPRAPSFSPICRAYLTRGGSLGPHDMAIRTPTAWDAPLQECQHALNFFHCAPCSSQQKLRNQETCHFHNEHEHICPYITGFGAMNITYVRNMCCEPWSTRLLAVCGCSKCPTLHLNPCAILGGSTNETFGLAGLLPCGQVAIVFHRWIAGYGHHGDLEIPRIIPSCMGSQGIFVEPICPGYWFTLW